MYPNSCNYNLLTLNAEPLLHKTLTAETFKVSKAVPLINCRTRIFKLLIKLRFCCNFIVLYFIFMSLLDYETVLDCCVCW